MMPNCLKRLLPDYPATGKRTLQDNGSWLRTLCRDNVDLVRTPIAEIAHDAVVTDDGVRATRPRSRVRHRLSGQPGAVADDGHRT